MDVENTLLLELLRKESLKTQPNVNKRDPSHDKYLRYVIIALYNLKIIPSSNNKHGKLNVFGCVEILIFQSA